MYITIPQAEHRMLDQGHNKEYLPIDGLAEFKTFTTQLLFGETLKGNENRVNTMLQTIFSPHLIDKYRGLKLCYYLLFF